MEMHWNWVNCHNKCTKKLFISCPRPFTVTVVRLVLLFCAHSNYFSIILLWKTFHGYLCGLHGLRTWRAPRTKSRGPKDLRLQAPTHLVFLYSVLFILIYVITWMQSPLTGTSYKSGWHTRYNLHPANLINQKKKCKLFDCFHIYGKLKTIWDSSPHGWNFLMLIHLINLGWIFLAHNMPFHLKIVTQVHC